MQQLTVEVDVEQGSQEWLALRKTKITATDAGVILGKNPWKTKLELYNEKIGGDVKPLYNSDAAQRGTDLEPIARSLFCLTTGQKMTPKVLVKDWVMASLDGINDYGTCVVEIKCPGEKYHAMAVSGKVPDHYYPQLQHQMYVAEVAEMYYYSFDGVDGVIVAVPRNDEYIEKMLIEERKFYECIMSKTPPEPEDDYIVKDDPLWKKYASRWTTVAESIKLLEKEEEELRKQLVYLAGECNCRGGGISLSQISRKGNVDYARIEALKNIDLEQYRKPPTISWRITC